MQEYFKPHNLTNDEVRHIFLARSRMLFIRDNYSNQYKKSELFCQSCLDNNTRESQWHVFSCLSLSSGELSSENICYQDLFEHNLEKQILVSRILKRKLDKRTEILEKRT